MTRVSLSSDGGAVMSTSVTARERVAMESGKAPTMERENNSEKEQGQGSGSKSETGGPARAGAPVEELLGRLNLEEEEDAGFVWEEEVKDHEAKAKWLAIAKVHTERGFSPSALYADMRSAWNPAKEVAWRKIEDNLFTIQFACLGDWNKAMLQGPWVFRNQAVMIEEYDGFANPRSIVLDKITVWAQVLKLPNMLLKESVIRGDKFTWHRGGIRERLDRALACDAWRLKFPDAVVENLNYGRSDHRPILLKFGEEQRQEVRGPSVLRFEARWLKENFFNGVVEDAWKASAYLDQNGLAGRLALVHDSLHRWD
ncbi:hypothetical protein ACQ4PT_002069 [Festuca glaucescens]